VERTDRGFTLLKMGLIIELREVEGNSGKHEKKES